MTVRAVAAILVLLAAISCKSPAGGAVTEDLKAPDGFSVGVFADGLDGARFMALDGSGILYVTLTRKGSVVALPDRDRDGVADIKVVAADGLDRPHGIAFFGGHVYIAETGRVLRFGQDPDTLLLSGPETIVPELPTEGGGHYTRTVTFGPDSMMYVSVGSSCNACIESDRRRAAVLRYDPDGGRAEIFAAGLRNAVGLVFHPETGELFGTENGRDWLGDDLPPDEVNVIAGGKHYGWPFCYGKMVPDEGFGDKGFCAKTEPPALEIQAHSAPLGLAFYMGDKFPDSYRGRLFVALHGSWNRSVPTGYKVVSVPFSGGRPSGPYADFVTGWLKAGNHWGRPVDVLQGPGGELFISDDYGGRIYRVTYEKTGR